ncbi:AAA family ATPase [Paraliomyxa miuraensis]|uniref:AAA family ATPase n=1 Tax=Paraliomyxa miuraensis TaxID=376150 RepID=UPI002259A6CE|nr:AAA family ATPase [Paraliomyxa miuraensis]MCX4241140.1 AAA family ATPase [Paraliomyxa miuraensis]
MTRRPLSYNPGLLSGDELIDGFILRHVDLELIVETIRDNDGPSNQHVIVTGARGLGKTTLVNRVALEMNRDPQLRLRWTPVLFGEESYEVGSIGELWLKALQRLAEMLGDARWRGAFEAIRGEKDEERLRERALGRLIDYAKESRRRVLLVIENIDMLLREQIATDSAWTLRHALQQHPEIMLLGTALDYDDVFGHPDLPLYGLAREHRMQPLTLGETRELWNRFTGEDRGERPMIPIHRLTGGNPRLLAIVASFSTGRSFRESMNELTALIDEHTSYFKAMVEALPPAERRVYSTLADLWAPATSRHVGERCRMNPSKASALLSRLVSRRMVEEVGSEGRAKRYQLTERLYNVYYLLRNRGGQQHARLEGLVEFMAMFYESDELADIMGKLAVEATTLPEGEWGEHIETYRLLMEKLSDHRRVLLATPDAFMMRVLEARIPDLAGDGPKALDLLRSVVELDEHPEKDVADRARRALEDFFGADGKTVVTKMVYALVRSDLLQDLLPKELLPEGLDAGSMLGFVARLIPWVYEPHESVAVLESLRGAFPHDRDLLVTLTFALGACGRVDDALAHARSLVEARPKDAGAWALLGHVLEAKGELADAASAYRKSLDQSDEPRFRLRLAAILSRFPERLEEGLQLSRSVSFEDGESQAWLRIARAERDPERAAEVAKKLLLSGDIATGVAAIEVLVHSLEDPETAGLLVDVIEKQPESPGAAVCLVWAIVAAAGVEVAGDHSWKMLSLLLEHPQWKEDALSMAGVSLAALLALGRRDRSRTLAMLETLDGDALAAPPVVAVRMILGGDVSDVPQEIMSAARDLALVLEPNWLEPSP